MQIAEVFRKYLGWCPRENVQSRVASSHPDCALNTPPGSGTFKTRALNWLGLFRNQMVVLALYFSAGGILLSRFIGGSDASGFMVGIAAGSLLSVFQCYRVWKTMNEVLEKGAVFLMSLYDKTTIAVTLIAVMIPMVISVGAVPGLNLATLNSVTGGFVFILFWWCLLVVWIWELQSHRKLKSDGMMLSLVRGN